MANSILVDLKRCTGCWSCSFACKVGNHTVDGEWWQFVRTVGGLGIDEPAGEWPNLSMSWMPVYTDQCVMCNGRTSQGELPYCVFNCPVHALTFGDADDPESAFSKKLQLLKDKGAVIYEMPGYERTKKGVVYAAR